MNFDSFLGNAKVIERLRSKLQQDRFPHGLIFSGPEGVGKRTCALMVAKALNCPVAAVQGDFCDACPNCHKIDAGTHPDVMMIGVEEDNSVINIDQIRRVLAMLDFQPLEGRNKVFIIDPANLMNANAANALLKGLEEPPQNSYFFLITVNVQELFLTVRSRCQVYNFSPLTLDEIRRLGTPENGDELDELLVRWSQGSIGRARSLDMVALKQEREGLFEFLETAVTAKDTEFREMLAASADLSRSKQDFPSHLAVLTVLLADLLRVSEGMPEKIVNIDMLDRLADLASRSGSERLLRMADFLRFIESSMKNYVNRQMLADVLALVGNDFTSKILHDNPRKNR